MPNIKIIPAIGTSGLTTETWYTPEKSRVGADISLEVNKALYTRKVPANITIQLLSYNEKGNLSTLMGTTATNSMILP